MRNRKNYHICLSVGDEVYCRCEDDFIRCFNSLALAVAETDSILLADAEMTNHIHECVRTSTPEMLVSRQRYSYSRYFSNKYGRRGRFGERTPCIVELEGVYHLLTAISYVLRNPLHHGVTSTPFGYPFSSIGVYFKEELHGHYLPETIPDERAYRYLPYRHSIPEGYHMDKRGMILRETVIDIADVEHNFATPRSFLFYMNRLSNEEWIKEQRKDGNNVSPITLDIIEHRASSHDISQMLINEHGRSNYNVMSDLQLCKFIDTEIVINYGKTSVYALSRNEKNEIANMLYRKYRLPEAQIKRCLAMGY